MVYVRIARLAFRYFNDHPYPVASRGAGGLQTSAEEVAFRWQGLSEWMAQGLTFWWFDHNWGVRCACVRGVCVRALF